MDGNSQARVPVLLMVSGGSDSTALLELAYAYSCGELASDGEDGALAAMLAASLPEADALELSVLHVNHCLRGAEADADEAFVAARCAALGIPCTARRVDVAARAQASSCGLEATARAVRYELAGQVLDELCARARVPAAAGIVCTAHTLDDRVETFLMRTLVGTGPGGLSSIPRVRGRIRRPLLDATREQLRTWLRTRHAGCADAQLWREDASNDDGSNFRSQVRTRLVPVMRELRPGFERPLARTMDLIASEDEGLSELADAFVYRNARFDGRELRLPCAALAEQPRFLARRMLRASLLMLLPDARLESAQIERVLDGLATPGFATELSGGIRARVVGDELVASVEQ